MDAPKNRTLPALISRSLQTDEERHAQEKQFQIYEGSTRTKMEQIAKSLPCSGPGLAGARGPARAARRVRARGGVLWCDGGIVAVRLVSVATSASRHRERLGEAGRLCSPDTQALGGARASPPPLPKLGRLMMLATRRTERGNGQADGCCVPPWGE